MFGIIKNISFKQIFGIFFVLLTLSGIFAATLHHDIYEHSTSHQEEDCSLCSVAQSVQTGFVIKVCLLLVVLALIVKTNIKLEIVYKSYDNGIDLTLEHPGLDPPIKN